MATLYAIVYEAKAGTDTLADALTDPPADPYPLTVVPYAVTVKDLVCALVDLENVTLPDLEQIVCSDDCTEVAYPVADPEAEPLIFTPTP